MPTLAARTSSVTFPEISTGLNSVEWARGTVPLAIRRLRAVILLEGTVRGSRWLDAIDRSTLLLPILERRTVLEHWAGQVAQLAENIEAERLQCRILVGRRGFPPVVPAERARVAFSVEQDPAELRGTGGLLRDVADGYDPNDYLLVATATQPSLEPLMDMVRPGARTGSDVVVYADADHQPLNVFLVACGALQQLPRVGFIDLKEQGIPQISRTHSVTIAKCGGRSGQSVRTVHGFLETARRFALGDSRKAAFAEQWASEFSLIEPGARVSGTATVHDSVVLSGGRVGNGAVVVNSVVCPGGIVRSGQTVVDRVVASTSAFSLGSE